MSIEHDWRVLLASIEELTPREREILALVAEGMSNGAIARLLWLSCRTVESHISSIQLKVLGKPSRDDVNVRVRAAYAYWRYCEVYGPGRSAADGLSRRFG